MGAGSERGGGIGFDEDVHLLAWEETGGGLIDAVDDLEDAGIDPFIGGSGQGDLGDDAGYEADEDEGLAGEVVAADDGGGGRAIADADGFVFIDIDPDVEGREIAHEDEIGAGGGGGEFAGADADLEDVPVDGCEDG